MGEQAVEDIAEKAIEKPGANAAYRVLYTTGSARFVSPACHG
jgi:hypothetical protein